MSSFKIVYRGASAQTEEKKSRFIANIFPAESEEEALSYLSDIKKQYWDARHNCYAYTTGYPQSLSRCSDDGEPAGTAGRPMLEVLTKAGVHNCIAVVTRYFGGVLLGTGGLVRAYQGAVKAALDECVIVSRESGRYLTVCSDYSDLGKIQFILGQEGIFPEETIYAEDVTASLIISDERYDAVCRALTEGTGARVRLKEGDKADFAVLDKKIIIFK